MPYNNIYLGYKLLSGDNGETTISSNHTIKFHYCQHSFYCFSYYNCLVLDYLGCPWSAMLIMRPDWCYIACIGNLILSIKSVTPVEINVSLRPWYIILGKNCMFTHSLTVMQELNEILDSDKNFI